MKRTLNVAGSALTLAGIALLIYVAISYERSRSAAPSSTHQAVVWSPSQARKGQQLEKYLLHHQTVAVPQRLLAVAPPGREPALRIAIAKIRVDAPVVQTPPSNGEWEVADWSVGHLTTTPNPGANGNDALSAHDDIKGEIFKRLGELGPGDDILLYTKHSVYTYTVVKQQIVDPSDVSVLAATTHPTITLISCTPYWVDTQRVIVKAVLKSRAAV
jgi:LPXTG-site transpeptidase (sortase) family protein